MKRKRTVLEWRSSSWKYVVAHLGILTIFVERTSNPLVREWRVGEVFGQHHHGEGFRSTDIYEVQLHAEALASRLLKQANAAARKAGLS